MYQTEFFPTRDERDTRLRELKTRGKRHVVKFTESEREAGAKTGHIVWCLAYPAGN